ncbi:response regulator, partial [Hungatella effluvii]
MIRLLIVDDEYYIRLGIKNAIDWKSIGIEIVGEAEDGEQGLAMALELEPDLLLIDIRMPFLDGLELLEEIAARHLD